MSSDSRSLLRYPEDKVNLVRGLTAFPILVLPAITGFPDNQLLAIAYGTAVWFLLCDINFLLHQHVHLSLTRSETFNKVLSLAMSLTTGMSSYNWRQQHIYRHHKGNDSWGLARPWEFRKRSVAGYISYSLRGMPVIFLAPALEAFSKGILENQKDPINYRMAFVEQLLVFATMGLLIYLEPVFYPIYFFLVYLFTRGTDYDNHVGCGAESPGGSNSTDNRLYNLVRNNFGYHAAHH
ncbi:MAG: fatty acid desaturase, partial [Gammaproteobacteria bacterium]|nr:fatty acid desaturase [Gammaproteobacteria bacterium]